MSITSQYGITITWTGDVEYSQEFDSTAVSTGSGQSQKVNLSSGNNSITVPSSAVGVTIIPPDSNAVQITLKGVNGDTGVALHLTNPALISLQSVTTFVLNAANAITGVRLIYS